MQRKRMKQRRSKKFSKAQIGRTHIISVGVAVFVALSILALLIVVRSNAQSHWTVVDGYDSSKSQSLTQASEVSLVQSNDNNFLFIPAGSYASFKFNPSTPLNSDSKIRSVTFYVEIFDEPGYKSGDLVWNVGSGWPSSPVIWGSKYQDPPSVRGPKKDFGQATVMTLWDVTSFVNTTERANSMELQIQNNSRNKDVRIDHLYAAVD